jgi:hypothetical protein
VNVEPITDLIANNLEIAAPLAALFVSWILYGILGKRFLGADDDYWPAIRNRLLPLLDRLGATSGLYAKHQQSKAEFVGIVAMDEEAFEVELEDAGFYRNPLAAVKRSPSGWKSDGSWARRYGRIRGLGEVLRSIDVPVAGLIGRMLGRFLAATGDILARRQLHVTIYTEPPLGGTRLHLYAHDEPNSLNPLTAWRHYVGKSWNAERGVDEVRDVLDEQGVQYSTSKPS